MSDAQAPVASRDVIRAAWTYTPADFIRASTTHFFGLWWVRVFYALNLIGAFALGQAIYQRGFQLADLKGVGWLLVWFVFLPAINCWSGWSLYRHLPVAGRSASWMFSPDGIQLESGLGNASITWEAVRRVVETRRAFHMFSQKNLFHIVPKRGFADDAAIAAVRMLLVEKLARRARVKRSW
jgi:hypothetical protein